MVLLDIQAIEAKIKLLGIVDCEYLEYFRNVDCIVTNYNEASKPQNYKFIFLAVCSLVLSHLIGFSL